MRVEQGEGGQERKGTEQECGDRAGENWIELRRGSERGESSSVWGSDCSKLGVQGAVGILVMVLLLSQFFLSGFQLPQCSRVSPWVRVVGQW